MLVMLLRQSVCKGFNPCMPIVSLMTHKEIYDKQIVKRIFDSFSMFKDEYKVRNDRSEPYINL